LRDQLSLSDQALVEEIKSGSEGAFDLLLKRYQGKVYRLTLSLTKNPADAEEVLQDVFLTVYRKIAGFERRSAFSTWLYRITVNTALMKLRGRGPVQESIDEYLPQFTKDGRHARMVADFTQGPEKLLLQKEREQVLREAIEALPPDYKVVLILRDLEGLSNEEVAEVVGASVLAVKARLHRARLALRGRLEQHVTASGVRP
jgi:RNA polymerase sigma-70 factor (ECF subfamily)